VSLARGLLVAAGARAPAIVGDIQPFGIHHGIATGGFATRECSECHSRDSRLTRPMVLAENGPHGVEPRLVGDANLTLAPPERAAGGRLVARPALAGLHVFGHTRSTGTDNLGLFLFGAVVAGALGHGALRVRATWLHEALALFTIANAFLALFYHLATGAIRQFFPQPRDFFSLAVAQVAYYLRGIFIGAPHPLVHGPGRAMNVLQQVTYLAVLNLVLPVQVATGILMWQAEAWAPLVNRLGGLGAVAHLHVLCAWVLAAFTVMHVYMTTTGRTPLAHMRAMVLGWEEVPDQQPDEAIAARARREVAPASHEVAQASHEVARASHEAARARHEVAPASHEVARASHEIAEASHEVAK
jgi:thiosulfate reductase cytochrome b subunit